MQNKIEVYVSLLDEGTPTLLRTHAVQAQNGLYELLATPDYNPEYESWDLLPGSFVRLEKKRMYDGSEGLVARHSNPELIHVEVESYEEQAPQLRETYALPVGNGLYKLLPTPHYTESQLWKFPPGSIVRIEARETALMNYSYWIAVERVG